MTDHVVVDVEIQKTVEIWRDIFGQEGRYQVSNWGRVKALRKWRVVRYGTKSGGKERGCWDPEKILVGYVQRNGYKVVDLSGGNRPGKGGVHVLVLEAFVGLRPPGMEARHFPDPNKLNNRLENLSWGTSQDNADDRIYHGTTAKGTKNGRAVLSEDDVKAIRGLRGKMIVRKIIGKYNIAKCTVYRIWNKEQWGHV